MDVNETHIFLNDSGIFEFEDHAPEASAIIMMIVLAVATFFGLAGNVTVASLISTRRRLQNIPNIYLLHRALADIFAQCITPILIASIAMNNFPFGYIMCIFASMLIQVGYVTSTVFLVLLAIDCYLASRSQYHTLQYRWKVLKIGISVTWGVSTLLILPVYFTTEYYKLHDDHVYCFEGPLFTTNHKFIWFLSVYTLILVPIIVLWVFVGLLLPLGPNKSSLPERTPGPTTEGEAEREEEGISFSTRAMLLSLAIALTLCQMPYWTAKVFSLFGLYNKAIHVLFICVFECLHPINPILYIWFRKDLWQRVTSCLPSHPTSSLPLENL